MADIDGSAAAATDRIYRKVALRIIPLLVICYLFAYIDRVNIGFAKLQMSEDLGLSEAMYGLGAGMFFLGYVIFEVPSNLLLHRIGARKTFVRILVLWGLTSAAMMFARDPLTFYVLRFLLGVFEAGFAPGMILYATYWFPRARMAAVMSVLMIPGPLGSMIGGPISTGIIVGFDGVHGLAGWQWVFLLEGLPCVLLAVIVWWTLPDGPRDAHFLTAQERDTLERDLAAERPSPAGAQSDFRTVIGDWRIYVLAGSYFALISGLYGISFWLPTILAENGVDSVLSIGLWSAVPYAAALVLMRWLARRSDRRDERRWHIVVPTLVGAAGLGVAAFTTTSFALSISALVIATACLWGAYTVFWALPATFLSGSAAAGGIAYINSIGLLGGFVSPTLIGYTKELTGSTAVGLLSLVGLLVGGALLLALTRLPTGPIPHAPAVAADIDGEDAAR